MKRGQYKYTCAECGCAFGVRPHETTRAAGIKCPRCGSRFVDPSKASMYRKILKVSGDAKREADDIRHSKTGGS